MSQITCPECKKQISESSNVCPNCGYPISSSVATHNEETKLIIKCPDCGNLISDKYNPCPNCACPPDYFVEVEQTQIAEQTEQTQIAEQTEQTEQEEEKPKINRKVGLPAFLLLLALFLCAYFAHQAAEQKKQEEYQRQQEEERIQQEREREREREAREQEAREREAREREARMARLKEYVSGETFAKREWIDNYTVSIRSLYFHSEGLGIEDCYIESMTYGVTRPSKHPFRWSITMDGELRVVYANENCYIYSIDMRRDCIQWGDGTTYYRH